MFRPAVYISAACVCLQGEAVAICTIEKACGAVSKLMQDRRLGELACVVVDEAHMVADGDRCAGRMGSAASLPACQPASLLASIDRCPFPAGALCWSSC